MSAENNETNAPEPKARPGEKRDQLAVMCSIVAVALVVFMVLLIPTGPLKKFRRAQSDLDELRQQRQLLRISIEAEQARLRSQEALRERLANRDPGFDLWSFLNTALAQTDLRDRANLERVKARTRGREMAQYATMVELRLPGVTLEQLVKLLHRIYNSNNLVVLYKLDYLRPTSDGKGLECSATFLSPNA